MSSCSDTTTRTYQVKTSKKRIYLIACKRQNGQNDCDVAKEGQMVLRSFHDKENNEKN